MNWSKCMPPSSTVRSKQVQVWPEFLQHGKMALGSGSRIWFPNEPWVPGLISECTISWMLQQPPKCMTQWVWSAGFPGAFPAPWSGAWAVYWIHWILWGRKCTLASSADLSCHGQDPSLPLGSIWPPETHESLTKWVECCCQQWPMLFSHLKVALASVAQ